MKTFLIQILQAHLLKLLTTSNTLKKQSKQKSGLGFAMILVLFSVACLKINQAQAGVPTPLVPDIFVLGSGTSINGAMSASANIAMLEDTTAIVATSSATATATGDTSYNVYLNYLKSVEAYAKQTLQYQEQVIQVEAFIRDLEENPLNAVTPDANKLMANQKKIEKLAAAIETNSSNVGANLIKDLTHPDTIGLGQGSKFQLWSEARRKASEESYQIVTDLIKDAKVKNKAITATIKNADAAVGQTASQKAIALAAGQQLSLLQEIGSTLNQLLGGQAVENGAKLEAEMEAYNANQNITNAPPGSGLIYQGDGYKGPGKVSNKGF